MSICSTERHYILQFTKDGLGKIYLASTFIADKYSLYLSVFYSDFFALNYFFFLFSAFIWNESLLIPVSVLASSCELQTSSYFPITVYWSFSLLPPLLFLFCFVVYESSRVLPRPLIVLLQSIITISNCSTLLFC